MDSMKSLNRSLPRETTAPKPPEAVLQAFRDAALSVTKLYKEATNSQQRERQAGYQEALDDLLIFLDKENLGLGDGEGWRVRRWATERLDGSTAAGIDASESEDERESVKQGDGDTTAAADAKDVPESSPVPEAREVIAVPKADSAQPIVLEMPNDDVFTFRSDIPYPKDIDMDNKDSINNNNNISSPELPQQQQSLRSRRSRHTNSNHKHNTRHNANRSLGPGSGSKRKFSIESFFDLSNFDSKDGFGGAGGLGNGGNKKGRTT